MPGPAADGPEGTSVAPPGPAIPLSALLADEELGLRLIAGAEDPAAVAVHWVHTSEMADPFPYLLGGELLLTAGVQLAEPERGARAYAERVVAAGGAALGFGLAPVYDTVPDALVEACAHTRLPLLEVPPRTTFTAVGRAVWRLMGQARHRELRRVTEAQQALASAAARPDPVPAVLHALASRLPGRAVLYAGDGRRYAEAGRALPDGTEQALGRLAARVTTGTASAADTVDGAQLTAYALGGTHGLALALATGPREPGDHTVAGVAVVLLSLLTARHQGADEATRTAALVRLLLGAAPEEAAAPLGPAPWTVVHAQGEGPPPALGTPLVDTGDGTVRALLPHGHEVAEHPGWTLGVSAPAAPGELPAADAQASRALRRARAAHTPLARHRASGLAALVDPAEAATHASALLAPLGGAPLTTTLRAWLSLHGSWDRTATALGVHRNTVRQRIARCATLLGTDLDDPDIRMELWFALRAG
ncbi:PucR family transcriptional regulator [Streptomyces lichenis]|uniref:PucR family transcriptional regulator n=1 Tax=Streptomyces lichenis TaxID=2306967 RepID=A0ABT0I5I1_9ACTN|nr:PucR family transcriptional regulator [Streptomyces lichenis]MCK8676542.1 PucR family transcriptional regulator [Streptomyces lichenis]